MVNRPHQLDPLSLKKHYGTKTGDLNSKGSLYYILFNLILLEPEVMSLPPIQSQDSLNIGAV